MRIKCLPGKLKKPQPCRLCGRPVVDGYILKGAVRGCSCEACYRRFYGPIVEKTAFHVRDIFTGSFWRPFHIEEGVVMFPALSASRMDRFNYYIRRGIPVLLIILLLAAGFNLSTLHQIPGHILYLLSQLVLLFKQAGSHLITAAGHLPGAFEHLLDGGALILSALLRMVGQIGDWIRSLI